MKNIAILAFGLASGLYFSQEIKEARIKEIVSTLASDDMKGRKFGTEENMKAAQYIAEQFKQNKLDYCYGDSYLVPFTYKDGKTYYNVCGVKKGTEDSYIAFGAHFDHIGEAKEGEDKIFNGADDDASGVSTVIGLSDYYKGKKTKEGLIFMAFNGEEIGLVGSKYLANDEKFQTYIPKIKALFNFEMLGTPSAFGLNKVYMTGHDQSDLDEIINANAPKGFEVAPDPYLSEKLFFRSDNVNFVKKGIVAHSFSTVDMEHQNHYHQVNDDINVINTQNLTQIVNSFAKTIDQLMKKDFKPKYVKPLQ
ncbi:MAG: M28 family peptidase [Flavobacteriaceae bacterium]|jgi:hypothetical protein|nr:M28 family peptidase [Flavobacteriaceae bacterium]